MTTQNCDLLLRQLRRELDENVGVRSLDGIGCVLQIPFFDNAGDPINIVVSEHNGRYVVEDAGKVAGHLFAMGQHGVDSPSVKLLMELQKAYKLEVDFNEGVVRRVVERHELMDAVMDLSKVIITVVTASPHIRLYPQRIRRFGPRLRAKIKERYLGRKVLELVEQNHEIAGLTVDRWPIDFHWQVGRDSQRQDVFVVAVDLDVTEPLKKVEHLSALAVDVRSLQVDSSLRVVMDRHGKNSDATVASAFLQQHRQTLGFQVFDFGLEREREAFIDASVGEILGEQGREWRNLWKRRVQIGFETGHAT